MARIGLFVCIASVVGLLLWITPRLLPEDSPVARGALLANGQGCIECHGRPGQGFPNDAALSCIDVTVYSAHPDYDGRCGDLLAYFEVVRLKRTFPSRANPRIQNTLLQGESLARQYNCFQCHGELGQGGFRNPGALKGYVPGYFGRDFALLTRDGNVESVRAWITHGLDADLVSTPVTGPIAQYFIERQDVSMPIFGSLPEHTIQQLADYVIALNRMGAMDAQDIRSYSRQTQ